MVTINTAEALGAIPKNSSPKLRKKARGKLIELAKHGVKNSFKILLESNFLDLFDDAILFHDLAESAHKDDHDDSNAALQLSYFNQVPHDIVSHKLVKDRFKRAAQTDFFTYALSRTLFELTTDQRFDIKYRYQALSDRPFEKCAINQYAQFLIA